MARSQGCVCTECELYLQRDSSCECTNASVVGTGQQRLGEPGVIQALADLGQQDSGPSAEAPVPSGHGAWPLSFPCSQTASLQPLGKCHFLS